MTSQLEPKYLLKRKFSLSISDAENLGEFGFRRQHLADAFCELSRHLIADGATLYYGGDLRSDGYTELLFELIATYRPDANPNRPVFSNILPWPVHMFMSTDELESRRRELPSGADISCLSLDGHVVRKTTSGLYSPLSPQKSDWVTGLSSMRRYTTELTDARIVLGGKIAGYMGSMPGIAEESLFTIKARKPIYLLGGFGGCAAEICGFLGLRADSGIRRRPVWTKNFERDAQLNNGLDEKENRLLATTPHLDEAVALILRGTKRRLGRQY